MDHSRQLGEERVSRLLLRFSVPAIIGMLVNALYNVVDRIFIGRRVGSLGIAGITVGFPIMIIIMAFGMLFGIGATSLMSIRLGEGKKEEAEQIIGNAMVLLIASALLISVLGLIFIDPLLRRFGASEAVLPYARDYLRIILFGAVFQSVGFGMNSFIRAEGSPKTAMFTMLIGAILNTILDPILIFNFNMGMKGAAYATIFSQAVSAAWVLYFFYSSKSSLKIHSKNLRLRWPIVAGIVSIGMAPFAMQLAASVLTVILNTSLQTYGGDTAISAMGVINSVTMLFLMPVFGINQGVQPIIGYNYGAQRFDRVKEALTQAIAAATAVVVLGFLATRFFPEALIRLFYDKDAELLALGSHALQVFLFFLPIIGFQIVGANYFQAVGKPKQAMFLSLSRQVLILIPALLILPRFYRLEGVFMAGPLADLIASVLTAIWLTLEFRHLKERHLDTESAA